MNRRTLLRAGLAVLALGLAASGAWAADAPKRVLLVTHSGGFMHDSIYVAEQVLKDQGAKNGFEVTCFRFTGDPDAHVKVKRKVNGVDVETETTALEAYSEKFRGTTGGPGVTREDCGRLNADTLKHFDAVFFFTTGDPVQTPEEKAALLEFIKSGKGFLGTHCATDTLYGWKQYGDMIGGYFNGHPWHTKVRIVVEDKNHPATRHLGDAFEITDEIYQQRDPYSREQLHVLMRLDPSWLEAEKERRTTKLEADRKNLPAELAKREAAAKAKADKILAEAEKAAAKLTDAGKEAEAKKARADAGKAADAALAEPANYKKSIENAVPGNGGARKDNDYAIAWCREFGDGRVFYTALGHRKEVWRDPRFQEHVLGGLKWAMKQADGDATPSDRLKGEAK